MNVGSPTEPQGLEASLWLGLNHAKYCPRGRLNSTNNTYVHLNAGLSDIYVFEKNKHKTRTTIKYFKTITALHLKVVIQLIFF